VNSVQCAVEAQQALRDAAENAPAEKRVLFRIGIHVGDVVVRGGDLLGSGVNVAARLEALADAVGCGPRAGPQNPAAGLALHKKGRFP
jgi:adenylate cyclase